MNVPTTARPASGRAFGRRQLEVGIQRMAEQRIAALAENDAVAQLVYEQLAWEQQVVLQTRYWVPIVGSEGGLYLAWQGVLIALRPEPPVRLCLHGLRCESTPSELLAVVLMLLSDERGLLRRANREAPTWVVQTLCTYEISLFRRFLGQLAAGAAPQAAIERLRAAPTYIETRGWVTR